MSSTSSSALHKREKGLAAEMKISLGMIVRDEALTLEKCLASVAPFVDEIVIGLAGKSSDNTEEIARKFTENVFDIEWKDDFAYARNLVLEACTGDYFLWLDGDDELINGQNLRAYPEQYPNVGAFHMGYDYGRDNAGNTITYLIRERLVRRDLGWKWIGRIHEVLAADIPHQAHLIEDMLVRHHYGKPRKEGRNLALLLKELEDTEPNPSQRLLLYLGNELATRGHYVQALQQWRRFITRAEWNEESYQVLHKIADVYREIGDYDRSAQADFDAIRVAPHWPDAYFGLAETSYKRGEWQAVVDWTLAAGTKTAPDTQLIVNPRDYDYWPLRILGLAYARLGNLEEGIDNLVRAYKVYPDDELAKVIDSLHQDLRTSKALGNFLALYEHLGRNDEWIKARKLFEIVPKLLETHPAVIDAKIAVQQSTAHIDDPQLMVDSYVNNPSWQPMKDETIQSPEWRKFPRMAFATSAAGKKPISILDVGCSDGFIDLPLAHDGHSIFGVDLDPRCVALANSRAREWGLADRAWFMQGSVNDVAVPRGGFDLTIAFEILEHVVRPLEFLDALDKTAKRIALTTPFLSWERGNLPNWNKVELKGHLRIFDLNDFEGKLLSNRGRIHNLYVEPWERSGWIFAEYEPNTEWSGSISILCPATLEDFGPRKLARDGLGGSETAAIRLAEAFSGRNIRTTVFGQIDSPGIYSGVTYRDNKNFIPEVHSDMLIAWRFPEAADHNPSTDHLVLWMHDTDSGDRLTEDRAYKFEKIVVLSEWHKSHMMKTYPFIPEEKYVIIGNGVDLERFHGRVKRDTKRVVYASSPDRGLDVILERIWPEVTRQVPDATLHVYYGWESFDRAAAQYPHLRQFKARISELITNNVGVVQHGRVDQATLATEMKKGSVWLYPTYFPETYCITAVEAQLAGLIPVTNQLAALQETVQAGIIIDGDVHDPSVAKEYTDKVIELLKGPDNTAVRKQMRSAAPAHSWHERAGQWLEMLGG